jgi:hypothetical protein
MRRSLLILAALVVIAAAGYSGYWFFIARDIRQGIEPWRAARAAQGLAITWRTLDVTGFPFRFRLDASDASLAASEPFPYAAKSAAIEAEASPFDLQHWRFRAPQGAEIAASQGAGGIAADGIAGTVAVDDKSTIVTAEAHGVAGEGLARGFAAATLGLSLTLPQKAPQTDRDPLASASLSLSSADLPQLPPAFPKKLDALTLAATLRGAIPGAPSFAAALAKWRDGGGTLDIESGHVAWAKTAIDLDGTLSLDEAMQPEGALTVRIKGGDAMIDAIVDAGGIEPRYADLAKAVLRAIGHPDDSDDTSDELRVPVTLQDRRIFVGPAPIAPLPQVKWH